MSYLMIEIAQFHGAFFLAPFFQFKLFGNMTD